MPLETRFEINNKYLHFYCNGPFKYVELRDAFAVALDLAVKKEFLKILVDCNEIYGDPPTMMERFKLGEYVAELCYEYKKPFQIAVVGKEPFVDPDRFGETVARNRGVNGKVFTDLDEAKEWFI